MFLAATCSLIATLLNPPQRLDVMPVVHARALDGKRVRIALNSAKPSHYWDGCTVIGCADRRDGVERSAILKGERPDVDDVEVVVFGVLQVIEHPVRVIDGRPLPSWVEIRVTEE